MLAFGFEQMMPGAGLRRPAEPSALGPTSTCGGAGLAHAGTLRRCRGQPPRCQRNPLALFRRGDRGRGRADGVTGPGYPPARHLPKTSQLRRPTTAHPRAGHRLAPSYASAAHVLTASAAPVQL
ncbi:hypothetical protein ACU4GD_19465 [Cupriavidus basilensis]